MIKKAHDVNKLQKLSNFDFTADGAHIALVDKAANGKTNFLVTKSLNPIEKGYDYIDLVISADSIEELGQRLEVLMNGSEGEPPKVDPTMVNMPLVDLLQLIMYISERDATKISESVVKSAADLAGIKDDTIRTQFTEKLLSLVNPDSASGAIIKNSQIEDDSMSKDVKTPDAKEVETLLKAKELSDQALEAAKAEIATLTKAAEESKTLASKVEKLEKAAEERLLKAFNDVAESYKEFGAEEGTGAILKAVAGLEGGEKVLNMLKTAKDLISKSELLDEVGSGNDDGSADSYEKLEVIAKGLMKDDPKLSHAAAIVLAASQNKELAR